MSRSVPAPFDFTRRSPGIQTFSDAPCNWFPWGKAAVLFVREWKSCFEIGDALEISLWITEPGYLNIISIDSVDQATILFPNQYHPRSNVNRGRITIPAGHMNYALMAGGRTGPRQITAFVTQSPLNTYANGFKTPADVLATLSPHSSRSLALRQKQEGLAAGRVTTRIRQKGHCR